MAFEFPDLPTTTPRSSRPSTPRRWRSTTTAITAPTSRTSRPPWTDAGRRRVARRGDEERGRRHRRGVRNTVAATGTTPRLELDVRRRQRPDGRVSRARSIRPSARSTPSRRSSRRPATRAFGPGFAWLIVKDESGRDVHAEPGQPADAGRRRAGTPTWCSTSGRRLRPEVPEERPDYIDGFLETADWAKASERFAKAVEPAAPSAGPVPSRRTGVRPVRSVCRTRPSPHRHGRGGGSRPSPFPTADEPTPTSDTPTETAERIEQ